MRSNQPLEDGNRREAASGRPSLDDLADDELIDLTLQSNDLAFKALLERHTSSVTGFLLGRLPPAVELEDLLQVIFLAAYTNLPKLRNRRRFGPWLMKIARNRLYDIARERKRIETSFSRAESAPGEDSVLHRLPAEEASPGDIIDANETERALIGAIAKLPDSYRVAVSLRLLSHLPPAMIAAQLGISRAATRVRLHRGLKKLVNQLREDGFFEAEPP